LGRLPSDIVAVYEFSAFKKILRINNPYFITPTRLPRVVVEAMIEDGRLSEDEDLIDASPQVDFLLECLTDNNFIVRREAIIAVRRFKDKQIVAPLIEALKDKHWDVRKNAAITLGEIGDSKAIEPLRELSRTESWEHLVRKEAIIALKKLES
jgi:HEAT repeat protein